METLETASGLPVLADLVWAQRGVATRLHYKLVVAGLILASDRRELVAPALTEVDELAAELAEVEQARLAHAAVVAQAWGISTDDLTLARLAEQAPAPWDTIFTEHRDAMADLAIEIEDALAENRRLASTALDAVRETLGVVAAPPADSYGADGRAPTGRGNPLRIDRTL